MDKNKLGAGFAVPSLKIVPKMRSAQTPFGVQAIMKKFI